jgi:hypothetical protein
MKRPFSTVRPVGPFLSSSRIARIRTPSPQTDEQAVRVYIPTQTVPGDSTTESVQSMVKDMTDSSVTAKRSRMGIMISADEAGRGPTEFPHEVLDVAETVTKKEKDLRDRARLIAANPKEKTLQSCFNPVEGSFTEAQLAEINQLGSFVTDLDIQAEQVNERLYIDTGQTSFGHEELDVLEIISSRVSFVANHNIKNNSILIRDSVDKQ